MVAESKDGRSDDLDGGVEIVHGTREAFGRLGMVDEALGTLEGHASGEEALDGQVVQVAGDSVVVLQQAHLLGVVAAVGKL